MTKKKDKPEIKPLTLESQLLAQHRFEAARKERIAAQSLKSEKARAEALHAEHEALLRRVGFVEDVRDLLSVVEIKDQPRAGRVLSKDRRFAAAVCVLSDLHIEEQVDPLKVNGMNAYNPAIAKFRLERTFAGIEWLIREQRGMFDVRRLLLILDGDLISGHIHDELVMNNYASPTHAVVFGVQRLAAGIRMLLSALPELLIDVACQSGNHGRTTKKVLVGAAVETSYEWLMHHMLMREFANERRVRWQIDRSSHTIISLYGAKIHIHHGHSTHSSGGIGGVDVPLNRARMQWSEKYGSQFSIVGHYHQYSHAEKLLRNGSLIGYSTYADWLASAAPEPPKQAFFLFDSKRGLCQKTGIWCGDPSAEGKLWEQNTPVSELMGGPAAWNPKLE